MNGGRDRLGAEVKAVAPTSRADVLRELHEALLVAGAAPVGVLLHVASEEGQLVAEVPLAEVLQAADAVARAVRGVRPRVQGPSHLLLELCGGHQGGYRGDDDEAAGDPDLVAGLTPLDALVAHDDVDGARHRARRNLALALLEADALPIA